MTGVGSPRGMDGFLLDQSRRLTAQERRQTPSYDAALRAIENLGSVGPGLNLVSNPSFERGLVDWDESGEDYSEVDTLLFRTGNYSLSSPAGMDIRRMSQPFLISAGATVEISGWYATDGPSPTLYAGLVMPGFLPSDGDWIHRMDIGPVDSTNGEWVHFSQTFRAPSTPLLASLRLATVSGADSRIWFDDIVVREVEVPDALRDDGRLTTGGLSNTGVRTSTAPGQWVVDANGVVESGWYWGSGSSLNAPTNYEFVLEVRSFKNGIRQVLTRLSSRYPGATWERSSYDSGATWTAWSLMEQSRRIYSPSIHGGLTVGNGSISGEYTVTGGMLFGQIRVSFGSTTKVTRDIQFNLPVSKTSSAYYYDSGRANFSGGSNYHMQVLVASYVYVRPLASGSGGITAVSANSSTPRSWNSGTVLDFTFHYPVGQAS
ncbi:MAG: hypothetical protein ACTH7X_08930 [Brevibacterium aurantiacum]